MIQSFHANGKLLLSAEYFVLDGAIALALPCRFGQKMTVKQDIADASSFFWRSLRVDGSVWFEGEFDSETGKAITVNDTKIAAGLEKILGACLTFNPHFLQKCQSVEVQLEFPELWGLGSSSTLIYMMAHWSGMNAFELSNQTFGGSGYDIACAGSESPILYQRQSEKPFFKACHFHPDFQSQLYFVYLGKKQNSRDGIQRFREKGGANSEQIEAMTDLTMALFQANGLEDFENHLRQHEDLVSSVIEMPKVQDLYFQDYEGVCKSLGAWGGDFILATSRKGKEETLEYFRKKGFDTVLSYEEMIKY